MVNYTSNPISLINEFATYLQQKGDQGLLGSGNSNSTALLGKFAGFLANSEHQSHENIEGISTALSTVLKFSTVHDFWIVDSGATDHMTNKLTNLFNLKKFPTPSHVSVANGYGVPLFGEGKLKLFPKDVNSMFLRFQSSCSLLANSLKHLIVVLYFFLVWYFFRTSSPRRRLVKDSSYRNSTTSQETS